MHSTRLVDPHGNLQQKLPAESLAAYLAAGLAPAASGHTLTGAKPTVMEPGWHKHAPTTITGDFALVNPGNFGAVTLELDIADAASVNDAALLDLPADIGSSETNFASISLISRMAIDGNAGDMADATTRLIHGLRMVAAASNAQGRVPALEHTEIRNFSGTGVAALGNWNQLRVVGGKFTANATGLRMESCQDSKLWGTGIGANLDAQLIMVACSTPMFTSVDFWTPTGGRFRGQFGIQIINGYGSRFTGCDIEASILIDGQNNLTTIPGSSSARHRWLFHTFDACTFKVGTDISEGYAAFHAGDALYQRTDGKYAPKGYFTLEDVDGLTLANSHFGLGNNVTFASDTPPTAVLEARPDFLFFYRSANNEGNAALQADRRGIVKISGDMEVSAFAGKQTASSAGYPVRKPIPMFARSISNDVTRIDWDGLRPKLMLDAQATPRYIKADGATGVSIEDNPLAYIATDPTPNTRHLQDGQTTFTMPNLTAPTAGYGWYFRRW